MLSTRLQWRKYTNLQIKVSIMRFLRSSILLEHNGFVSHVGQQNRLVCTPNHGQGHFHERFFELNGEEGRHQWKWMKTNIISLRRVIQSVCPTYTDPEFLFLEYEGHFWLGKKAKGSFWRKITSAEIPSQTYPLNWLHGSVSVATPQISPSRNKMYFNMYFNPP